MTGDVGPIRWGAWRVEEDGTIRVVLTRGPEDRLEREELRFASLEEASRQLGESFGDVVRRAMAEGHRRGRWRP